MEYLFQRRKISTSQLHKGEQQTCDRPKEPDCPEYRAAHKQIPCCEEKPCPKGSGAGGKGGSHKHKHGGSSLAAFRALSLATCIPLLIYATYVLYTGIKNPHIERPEFVPYSYLRRRVKKFPWGDGNHTLFHNPCVNALPDGYETELKDSN